MAHGTGPQFVGVEVGVEQPTAPQVGVEVGVSVAHGTPGWQVGVAVTVVPCTCWQCENSDVLPTASVAVAVRKEPEGATVGKV